MRLTVYALIALALLTGFFLGLVFGILTVQHQAVELRLAHFDHQQQFTWGAP